MPTGSTNRGTLEQFITSAPQPQRAGMWMLVAMGCRPRGKALIERAPALDQLAQMLLALSRYDDPGVALALGWDGAAVVAYGRALRRAEGRP
ncbi:MAG: hypothetical protein WBV85_02790 [Solirubrobacteraceae bacterium]